MKDLFKEYTSKNLALVLIDDTKASNKKVYLKSIIQGKNVSKNLNIKEESLNTNEIYKKIIFTAKKELVNMVKSKNLIDIRTPSFLNVKLNLTKKNNLVDLESRAKNIESIENIYVQEFNKDYMYLRIKYLGKLEKIINQLKKEKILLKLVDEKWVIKAL